MKSNTKKFILIPFIITGLSMGAADCSKKEPAPKPSKPVIKVAVVKICIEDPFDLRREEIYCGPSRPDDCCKWVYISFIPESGRVELPAIGETLRPGQGHPEPPAGSTPMTIPTEGAIWVR